MLIYLTNKIKYDNMVIVRKGGNEMSYKEIIEILKTYGRTTGHVWLAKNHNIVLLKYDTSRRYFLSKINPRDEYDYEIIQGKTVWHKRPKLTRVSQLKFECNVKWLLKNGYTICF